MCSDWSAWPVCSDWSNVLLFSKTVSFNKQYSSTTVNSLLLSSSVLHEWAVWRSRDSPPTGYWVHPMAYLLGRCFLLFLGKKPWGYNSPSLPSQPHNAWHYNGEIHILFFFIYIYWIILLCLYFTLCFAFISYSNDMNVFLFPCLSDIYFPEVYRVKVLCNWMCCYICFSCWLRSWSSMSGWRESSPQGWCSIFGWSP